jgi:hypothetical protein
MAMQGKLDLPPQYCKDCREVSKNGNNETVTDGHGLTAVEWLIEQIEINHTVGYNRITIEQSKQAKAMEKEQIMKAAQIVLWNNTSNSKEVAEQYYNETYQSNKD